jgi:CheY-like chemotaxis protein
MRAPPIADVGEELIHVIPSVLWVLFALLALFLFREPIRALLGRLESARLPGNVELTFGPAFERAVEKASKRLPESVLGLTPQKVERLLNRARRNADAVVGARVVWVDDEPLNNAWEREAMDALGIVVITARSTTEAEFFLERDRVDLVISDMDRPGEAPDGPMAGYTLRDAMHKHGVTAPLIFYILELDLNRRPPERTFAITNRPDELLDYVIDALRFRGPADDPRR